MKPYELEILSLIAQGFTSKEIAVKTKYAFTSVESYREKMIRKIGAKNTAHMVSIAYQNGLLK